MDGWMDGWMDRWMDGWIDMIKGFFDVVITFVIIKQGKKFSVWRLSDLSSQSACISFFLFDKVFQEHWKIPVGHVIGLLNSNIQTNKEVSPLSHLFIHL